MTSRKLITCLYASMVMCSPLLLKMQLISFLMFSVSLGVALVMASPGVRRGESFPCFGVVVASHCYFKFCVTFLLPG